MSIRKTEKLVLAIILAICSINLWAQTQSGYVKTIGRPERAGEPLGGVSVRASGGHNSALSDSSGCFFLTMAGKQNGDPYSIQQVFKSGYELNDYEVIGRRLAFSDRVPLNIVMVSSRQLQEDKQRIINNAYRVAEDNYKAKAAELERQNKENLITIETYREQLQALQSGFDKYQTLIESLADRYAHTDYDMLDEAEREINRCIEAGDLGRADSLIRTTFNPVGVLERNRDALSRLEDQISQAGEMLADAKSEMTELLKRQEKDAEYLYRLYTIALLRFETDDAAKYLVTRAELDTTNVEWQNEAGVFISNYIADYDKAMMLYRRALKVAVRKYGENHPDVAVSLNNIGSVYFDQGDYTKALEYYDKALKIRTELLGENHPDVAVSLNNIGSVYFDQGDYTKALEYYDKALKILTELLGEFHPDVATSLNNIGFVYSNQGDYNKALEYYDKVLKIQKELLGESHPDIAVSLNNIGSVYYFNGDYDKALEYYDKALKIQKELLGENHPDVARSLNNIGFVYSNQGDYDKALEYYDKALKIQRELLGENHPDVARSLNNIGLVYSNQGDYTKTLEYFDKALKIWTGLLGENHPDVAVSLNNIGFVYSNQGDYDKALEYFDKALKIRMGLLGENHPDVAVSLNNIGLVYSNQGDYDKALEYLDKALKIWTGLLGENHPDVATSLNNIGFVYSNQGDYDKALEYYDKALKIRTGLLGENHPDVAASLNNIGSVYLNQGDYDRALEHLDKALKILTEIFGEFYPNVATTLNNIAIVYYNQGDYDNALRYYNNVLNILIKLYGKNSPNAISACNNIYDCYTEVLKTSKSYIQPYKSFISEIAFTVTIVSDDTPAPEQGMFGEYYLLEFGDWAQDSFNSIYDKNTELKGKPKDILVMKDGIISEHHFEDTMGVTIGLKYVGKEEKAEISEAYDNWKKRHSHEYD